MQQNIFAYTARGANYPEYISLKRQEDGGFTVNMREPVKEDGLCGQTIRMKLPYDQMAMLGASIINWIIPGDLKP